MTPFRSSIANLVFDLCNPNKSVSCNLNPTREEARKILSFAAKNGVAPWLFFKINNAEEQGVQCPDYLKAGLKMHYLQTLLMNQQKWKVFNELHSLAQNNNIRIIPLKGTALAFSLYEQEALRPMGDIDILVPEKDIYHFRDLMIKKGASPLYVPVSKLHDRVHAHISALSWQNIMVEPHQRLFALGSHLNITGSNLFNDLKTIPEHSEIYVFGDVMQAYHLITHAYKGYKMGGMRLSWLLDIALLFVRNEKDPHFIEKIKRLNPSAETAIETITQWSNLLLGKNKDKTGLKPFPPEDYFWAEQDPKRKHKKMVLQEIAGLPGLKNKAILLFREFFPEKAYMNHQYGKHVGVGLLKLYLKRITGSISRRDNSGL